MHRNVRESTGDISIAGVSGSDVSVYIKKSKATYTFKNVASDVLKTFREMLSMGAGFNALRYLQKNAGKGVRESMNTNKRNLADRILAGEDIDAVLEGTEPKPMAAPSKTVMVVLTGTPKKDVELTMKQAGIPGQVVQMGQAPGGNNVPAPDSAQSGIPGQTIQPGDPVVRPNNIPAPMAPETMNPEIKMGEPNSTMKVRPSRFGQEPSVSGTEIQPGNPNYGDQSPWVKPRAAAPTSNIPGQSVMTGSPVDYHVAIMNVPASKVHVVKDQYPDAKIMEEVESIAQEQFGATKLRCENGKCDKNTSGMCQATNIHLSNLGVCQTQSKTNPPKYPKGR